MSKVKKAIVILMILLFTGCVNHGKYKIGMSVTEKVSLEKFVKQYLEAKCEGDQEFLSLIVEPGPYKNRYLDVDAKPLPEVCDLKIRCIFQDSVIESPESCDNINLLPCYLVVLDDVENKKEYIFHFYIVGERIYLSYHLKEL